MKVSIFILLMVLCCSTAFASEPLKGGVDYSETVMTKEGANIEIDWNTWIDNFKEEASWQMQMTAMRKGFPRDWGSSVWKLLITVKDDGSIRYQSVNPCPDEILVASFDGAIEQMQRSKFVKFPENTARKEITFPTIAYSNPETKYAFERNGMRPPLDNRGHLMLGELNERWTKPEVAQTEGTTP